MAIPQSTIFAIMAASVCAWVAPLTLLAKDVESVEALTQAVVAAPTPFHLRAAFVELLQTVSYDDLSTLKTSKYEGVAVQAAWEEVRRRMTQSPEAKSLPRRNADDFLGFVRGRIDTQVPKWWEGVIRNALWTGNSIHFPVDVHRPYHKTTSGYYAPSDLWVKEAGDSLLITVKDESFLIPKSSAGTRCIEPSLCGQCGQKVTYFGIHSGVRSPFSVVRMVGEPKKTSMFADVWAGPLAVHSGIVLPGERVGRHAVSLEAGKDRLCVFGADTFSVYLEVFDKDGKNICRFSSSYCPNEAVE